MRRTGISKYFVFGFNYSLMSSDGMMNRDKSDALKILDEFFDFLVSLDLQVTTGVAGGFSKIREKIRSGPDVPISQDLAKAILREIERIDPALDAELALKKAYVLTKKRYPLETLLGNPSELLSEKGNASLVDSSRRDFTLACVQIALSQPTAAAFHLMRTVEAQVRSLYFQFKKTKRLPKPMWGPMISQLRVKRSPKPSNKLLDHLDGMRVHFRNPTQHPDAFYTMDEAQDLLSQTIVAINMIASELPA